MLNISSRCRVSGNFQSVILRRLCASGLAGVLYMWDGMGNLLLDILSSSSFRHCSSGTFRRLKWHTQASPLFP